MINKLIGTKYPIIQGAMANIANGEFAASVSNAGGLGVIASGGFSLDEVRENIRKCKSLTDKPFAVNIIFIHAQANELVDMVIEEKVPIIITGAGNPAPHIKKWKDNNMLVIPVVPNARVAKKMQDCGADAVITEGNESGGHIGTMTTMTIVGETASILDIPVIAAGGISTGKEMLAARALGASGFQLGTRFLATKEAPIHENYKKALVESRSDQITVTGYTKNMPVRIINNTMAKKYLELEYGNAPLEELEKYTFGSLRKSVVDGDIDMGSIMCGLSVGQVNNIMSVQETMDFLVKDYNKRYDELVQNFERL